MYDPDRRLTHSLLIAEIERIVADAARSGEIVRAGEHAAALLGAHPDCAMSGTELVDEIIAAAAGAGVPVEMSLPPELGDVREPLLEPVARHVEIGE